MFAIMKTNNPFDPSDRFSNLFKRALGSGYELQQRLKALEGPLATVRELQRTSTFAHLASLQHNSALSTAWAAVNLHSDSIRAMQAYASSSWMLALQKSAMGISEQELGILKTQKLLEGATGPDVLKLAKTFDANRSIVETVMVASKWSDQFRALTDRFLPSLAGIKIAAERARMLDMMTLGTCAEVSAKSAVVIAVEQVLEAHRLIEAIGQAESPAQSVSLFAALLSVVGALFSRFGENTMKELRGVGAFRLIELVLMAITILHLVAPAEMSPDEQKIFVEIKVDVENLQDKLDKILTASKAVDESYVSGLPRAELKRDALIRCEARGKAKVLMRGVKGMPLAIKQSQGKWRLVVYRDLLTDQLSEGWVYAPAVQMFDETASQPALRKGSRPSKDAAGSVGGRLTTWENAMP